MSSSIRDNGKYNFILDFQLFHDGGDKPINMSSEMLACVAGGIVGAREIKFWRRSREENGERDFEIPPARKPCVFE